MLMVKTPKGKILAPEYARYLGQEGILFSSKHYLYFTDFITTSSLERRIEADKGGAWPPKYCKLDLELSDGTRVAFSDSRRFARVRWVMTPRDREPLSRMAPDALTSLPDLELFRSDLRSRFGSRKALKVKTMLLDQVRGGRCTDFLEFKCHLSVFTDYRACICCRNA